VLLAKIQAYIYCLLDSNARFHLENTWSESLVHKNIYGEPSYAEVVTYIGVITGSIKDKNIKVLKTFYGELRFDLEDYINNYNNREL
jgi:hypothetical protein